MSSARIEFQDLYEDRVSAHRLPYARDGFWSRWNEPSVVFSVLTLVITFAIKIYGFDGSLESLLSALGLLVWDVSVFLIPAPLLFALENRISRRTSQDDRQSTHAAKSAAMSRIVGLNSPGGVLASVSQARTRALSMTGGVLGLKPDFERPPGLGNRDNSCYQNSILQGLAALDSFSDYLSACVRAMDSSYHGQDVARTLGGLIRDLNDSANNGRTIWTPSLLKSMSTWTQQDAQEYFSKMLDDIDKGVAKAVREARRRSGLEADCGKDEAAASQHSDDSGYQSLSPSPDLSAVKPLHNPLEGLLAQRVACVQCGFSEGLSLIPFNCLTLNLGLDKNQHDLFERLDAYSRVESIEGVECPKCTLLKARRLLSKLMDKMADGGAGAEQLAEPRRRLEAVERALEEDDFEEKTLTERCKISSQGKVSSTKTKQIVVARPPQSLAVHVNRSVFDPTTFDMMKNSAPVSFPLTLDLGPWCLGSSDGADSEGSAGGGGGRTGREQWQLEPTTSMIAGDVSPSRLTGPIYELRAVVTHAGRHENGHYICYRKYPSRAAAEAEEAGGSGTCGAETATDEDGAAGEGEAGCGVEEASASRPAMGSNAGWWRLSDHNVSKSDDGTVLGQAPGVFMLFYERVDASMVLQSDVEAMEGDDEDDEASGGRPGGEAERAGGGDEGREADGGAEETMEPENVPLPASDDGEEEVEES
ncbi:hypothetical protein CDD83_8379 [Cordyceps sp. RAO-2017]|nr:hypothetical protein CDD83_8379 [Cordyceps sp. RAO-2017]